MFCEAEVLDLVTGEPEAPRYCYRMRKPGGLCGTEGKLFEPKEA